MTAPTYSLFTDEQTAVISQLLGQGQSPDQIASYLTRLNDLDEVEGMFIFEVAADLSRPAGGRMPRPIEIEMIPLCGRRSASQ